jgi:hypothetical protein
VEIAGMEIKDLTGLSKPLRRLIEVISRGVGAVSASYLIKKNALAKAEEIKTIAAALSHVAEQHNLPVHYKDGSVEIWQKPDDNSLVLESSDHDERADRRVDYQKRKRQHNVESITAAAAAELVDDGDVAENAPDEDWVSRFFKAAEDVSSEQMQGLWGRILAGEIKKPGSFSLKALDVLRNITRSDADLYEHVGRLALKHSSASFIAVEDLDWLQRERGVHQWHHFAIGELGAMYQTDLAMRFFMEGPAKEAVVISGGFILVLQSTSDTSEITLPIWKFTGVGQELLQLISTKGDQEYLEHIGKFFARHKVVAKLGSILNVNPDGRVNYNVIKVIEVPV